MGEGAKTEIKQERIESTDQAVLVLTHACKCSSKIRRPVASSKRHQCMEDNLLPIGAIVMRRMRSQTTPSPRCAHKPCGRCAAVKCALYNGFGVRHSV
jgi:hypothetical protein